MVDLKSQYLAIKKEVDEAIQNVIDSSVFIQGKTVREFEIQLQEYLQIPYVISCGNGTDALQMALMALGLQPGDEVITTPFTFIATAEVISLLHLTPVFVDVDPKTFNIDPALIEEKITTKTKAIIPVHLFGQAANMQEIQRIANQHSLFIIEDACQSLGTQYIDQQGNTIQTGTIGDIGVTSFFPTKNLGCFGDGGAIFTKNKELAERCRMIANHGSVKKYYYELIGVNSRLDAIQAAILGVKLKYLDDYIKARENAAALYDLLLQDDPRFVIPQRVDYSTHTFHQYTLTVMDGQRDQLKEKLAMNGIPSMIYYPKPLHLQKPFAHLGYTLGSLPVSESLSEQVLSLPMHTELTPEQQTFIVEKIQEE